MLSNIVVTNVITNIIRAIYCVYNVKIQMWRVMIGYKWVKTCYVGMM